MGSVNPILLVALGVLGVGAILHIVGMATPAWSTSSSYDVGPFKTCVDLGHGEVCFATDTADRRGGAHDDIGNSIDAVKGLTVLGCLFSFGAGGVIVLMLVLGFLDKVKNKIFPIAAAGLAGISFVFIIIGVIVWAAEVHDDLDSRYQGFDLDYSFALCIVGGILISIGGIVAFVGGNR